ncbi:MAG: cytochrome c oxidase subunit 3 [Bacteroidetes bacterium]|nr:cytochrome c oxidase subunit 3 [Bacteroidota bacterium]MBS1757631.1 cytochrome c oxidase subunit 3 [Bacteroidota bacterium]
MNTVMMENRKNRIHPHKFTLWVGIGSILMMFAGLTSAFIVKRNQANWLSFDIPVAFWYSTVVIIASSFTLLSALKAFKERQMKKYKGLLLVTLILGVLFVTIQTLGFLKLWQQGITLQANVAYSFLYVIVGIHAVHVVGGIVALVIMLAKSFSTKIRTYNLVPVELLNTYWHFVDILWLYLLLFLIMIK